MLAERIQLWHKCALAMEVMRSWFRVQLQPFAACGKASVPSCVKALRWVCFSDILREISGTCWPTRDSKDQRTFSWISLPSWSIILANADDFMGRNRHEHVLLAPCTKRPDLFAREQPLAQSIRDGSPAWLECCFGFKVTRWCHARLVLLSIARELLLIQHSTAQAGAKRDGFAGGFGSATVLM